MAWQLIYTSAPRLLEAGRSGFGTVARHRAIHPLLVTALERDSQFDRAAAAGRVIFAHRILTAAGSRFHVLTCIREAGADYTGRTNHIAHHLVIEPREIAALGAAAPNPADVFREMKWLTAWTDAPRWLEGADEIPLSRLRSRATTGAAWQTATGNARHAALLQPAAGVVLTIPPGTDALALFADSLALASVQAWQASFTTCLQQSDDVADFRWLALDATSPQRDRAAVGRTILDLTAPHSLPPPPAAAATSALPMPDAVRFSLSAPTTESANKPIGNLFEEALAAHSPKRKQGRPALWLGLAAAAIAIGAAAVFLLPSLLGEKQEVKAQRDAIRRDVINAFTGTDNGSAAELEHVPIPQLAVAGAIARAAHDTAEALRQRPLPKPQTAALHEQAKTAGLNIPPQIGKLFELHETFYGHQEMLKDIKNRTPGMEHLAKLREVHVALTRPEEDKLIGIGDALAAQLQALRKQLTANAEKLWAESELALLNGKTKPAESPVLFEEIRGPLPDSVAKLVPAMEASALVADWKRSIAIPQDTAQLKELRINRSGKWPNWLKEIVDEKLDRQPGSLGANPQAPVANAKSDVTPITNPDSRFEGELQISIDVTAETWTRISQVLSEEQLVLKLSALGGAMVPLTRSANGFRKGTGDLLFRYVNGEFNQASPPSPMPFELAVFSAQERKFTLWITPPKPTHAFRTVVKDGLRRQGETIRITGNEPISLCRTALDHRWNSKLVWKPETVNLPLSNEGIADLSAFLASLNEKVTKVEQRANELNEVIKGTRDPERLKAAIDDMKKYADDAGLQKPRADQEVNEAIQKAKGPDAIKWAKEEREENERLKMAIPPRPSQAKSLGAFLCYASNGNPMLNALYPIGKKLETIEPSAGPEGFAPQIQQALEVIAEKEKELQDRARFKGGRNAAEKAEARRIEDKAKSELQRVQRLKKFLSALLNLPDLRNDANNELTQVKKERMMLDKHPMRESGKLPPGDFELQVQPAPDAPWLTLVLFKNP